MRPWLLLFVAVPICVAQQPWRFAVSGDSRNCGDVVMPAIAAGVLADGARFYWHLGDFRALYEFDEDYVQAHPLPNPPILSDYLAAAWQDFIDNQLAPFRTTPVFLAFGNHELLMNRTREQLVAQFADWLDTPVIRDQRLRDNPTDHTVRGYYHWLEDGLDFITLDNASSDQFDSAQLAWLQKILDRDKADPLIRGVLVGMHEALPDSISIGHSMSQSAQGVESGRQVYQWLLALQKLKPVYVLASHSHFYMDGIFNTAYCQQHGGILPGWIIGTAGAVRYALPDHSSDARAAKTRVYGYLLATVSDSKTDPVQFDFHELAESDVPPPVVTRFTPDFIHACWSLNPPPSQ